MSLPKSPNDVFIGKYRVVQFIGAGGMAEVWLCRRSSIGGFEKPVVIKRILPAYAADPEFNRMFLDEARVAAGLNHPNIVQLYDIDTDNDVPFMAMEYVNGPSFQALLNRARRAGEVGIGAESAIRVICDVAAGLHYAHNATDADGEPIGLVHRDISPNNILISSEGVAKLLDFGVAKSRGRLSSTLAGTVKGKFSHMAPEQARSEEVDHRADVYSLGVCLYEATTGRLPFTSDNDVHRITLIVTGEFPKPSAIVPDYPEELEQIVLSAMALDREKRTPSAQRLSAELEAYAASARYKMTHTSVAQKVAQFFPHDDVSRGAQANPATPTPSSPGLLSAYRSPPRTIPVDDMAVITAGQTLPEPEADESVEVDLVTNAVPMTPSAEPAPRRSRVPLIAAFVGLLAVGVVALVLTRSAAPAAAPAPSAAPEKRAADVRAVLDQAQALVKERSDDDSAPRLAGTALDLDAGSVSVIDEARTPKAAVVEPPGVASAAKPAIPAAAQPAPRRPAPAPVTPTAAGFDSDGLLPSDPDSLLPPSHNN